MHQIYITTGLVHKVTYSSVTHAKIIDLCYFPWCYEVSPVYVYNVTDKLSKLAYWIVQGYVSDTSTCAIVTLQGIIGLAVYACSA